MGQIEAGKMKTNEIEIEKIRRLEGEKVRRIKLDASRIEIGGLRRTTRNDE